MATYKTYLDPVSFRHVVTSAEETATQVELTIKSEPLPTDPFECICQVRRAGEEIPGFNVAYSKTTGILTIANDGAVTLLEDDTITVMGTFFKD